MLWNYLSPTKGTEKPGIMSECVFACSTIVSLLCWYRPTHYITETEYIIKTDLQDVQWMNRGVNELLNKWTNQPSLNIHSTDQWFSSFSMHQNYHKGLRERKHLEDLFEHRTAFPRGGWSYPAPGPYFEKQWHKLTWICHFLSNDLLIWRLWRYVKIIQFFWLL